MPAKGTRDKNKGKSLDVAHGCKVHDIPMQTYWQKLKAMEPDYPAHFTDQDPMIAMFRNHKRLTKFFKRHMRSRFSYFHRFSEGLLQDEQGLYSVTPETFARHSARRCKGRVVLDLFAGVGGNAISFALEGCYVICVELDILRVQMIVHNARIYGVEDHIVVLHGDSLKFLKLQRCDVVFLSPPWGGTEYGETVFDLQDAMFINGVCLYRHCKAMTDNIMYYQPKRTPRPHQAALANLPACHCNGECQSKLSSGSDRDYFLPANPYRNFIEHDPNMDDWACTCKRVPCTETNEHYNQSVVKNVMIHAHPEVYSSHGACRGSCTTENEDVLHQRFYNTVDGVLQSNRGRVFMGHFSSLVQHANRCIAQLANMLHEGTDCKVAQIPAGVRKEGYFEFIYSVLQGSSRGFIWSHNAHTQIPSINAPPPESRNFYWIAQQIMQAASTRADQVPVLEMKSPQQHLHEQQAVEQYYLPFQAQKMCRTTYWSSCPHIEQDVAYQTDHIAPLTDGFCPESGHLVDQQQWDTVNSPVFNVFPTILQPQPPQPLLVLQPTKQSTIPPLRIETAFPKPNEPMFFPSIMQQCLSTTKKQNFLWKSSLDQGEIEAKAELLQNFFISDCVFNLTEMRSFYSAQKEDQLSDMQIIHMFSQQLPALVQFSRVFFIQFMMSLNGAIKLTQQVPPSSYLFYQAHLLSYLYEHKDHHPQGDYTLTLAPPVSTPLVCHAHVHIPYVQIPPQISQNVVEVQTMSLNGATKAQTAYYGHEIQNRAPLLNKLE